MMFRLLMSLAALCAAGIAFFSCGKGPAGARGEAAYDEAVARARDSAVERYVSSLPEEVLVSQLFLVNVDGDSVYHAVERTGALYGRRGEGGPLVPGGALLFSYNISREPARTWAFIKSIRDFYIGLGFPPPYVAVDQEGGDVCRLRGLTSRLLSQEDVAGTLSPDEAGSLYSYQARQMRSLGFHLNLAPVVEVLNDSNRAFLGGRAFGGLDSVLLYGRAAVEGYESGGVSVVLKHFPGNSGTDPHTGLPEISVGRSDLESGYIAPFEALLPFSSAVLLSHARVAVSDDGSYGESGTPACLSRYWVTEVLRERLGFTGLVLSDDIFMGALSDSGWTPERACLGAINAGVDVIMISEKRFADVAGIILRKAAEDGAFAREVRRAAANVIRLKIKSGIMAFKESGADGAGQDGGRLFDGAEMTVPEFTVVVSDSYEDFDPLRFGQDYKAGEAVLSGGL